MRQTERRSLLSLAVGLAVVIANAGRTTAESTKQPASAKGEQQPEAKPVEQLGGSKSVNLKLEELTNDQFAKITPRDAIRIIQKSNIDVIERRLSDLSAEQRTQVLHILGKTLELGNVSSSTDPYTDKEKEKIREIAYIYDGEGTLLDSAMANHPCSQKGGLDDKKCRSRIDGVAYANFARSLARDECWKTLKLAKSKDKAFREGIHEYYSRQARVDDGGLSQCVEPPEPSRCKLGWCTPFYDRGLSFAPLADLGVAVPIGHPTFGFQAGHSSSFQATAGIMTRAFMMYGKLDLRLGAGITNAVNMDGSGTPGLAWTAEVGMFQVLGAGFLWITDPTNGHTGSAVVFSIDLAGVRDLISEKTN